MSELRLDAGTVSNVRRTPQGGLRVDARLTRTGVLSYRRADGTVRRELRHPDEVFRADSLDTLRGAPVTDLHPSEMVRTDNHGTLARGHVGDDVRSDGGRFVAATLYVQDAALVDAVERGDRREISCGYTCDFDPTPGVFNGERFDGQQRNITYNHAALGPRDWGRAGNEVALRMDAADVWTSNEPGDPAEGIAMAEERKDEATEATPEAKTDGSCPECGGMVGEDGKAVKTDTCATETKTDAAEVEKMRGTLDARDAEITDLRKRLDEANDPKRIATLVGEAVEVRRVAERAGIERTDSLDVRGLRVAVVEKVTGVRCDASASADYVAGLYSAAVAQLDRDGVARARRTVDSPDQSVRGPIIETLRDRAAAFAREQQKGGR